MRVLEVGHRRVRALPTDWEAMWTLIEDLAFLQEEHRRCGWLDGGVEGERVWRSWRTVFGKLD